MVDEEMKDVTEGILGGGKGNQSTSAKSSGQVGSASKKGGKKGGKGGGKKGGAQMTGDTNKEN